MSGAGSDLLALGRVTLSLFVVLVAVVLVARLAKRAGVRGGGAGLQVLERAGLTREASVAVVSVGGRALVVGITGQSVRLLTELPLTDLPAGEDAGAAEAVSHAGPAPATVPPASVPSATVPSATLPPATGATVAPATGATVAPATPQDGVVQLRVADGVPLASLLQENGSRARAPRPVDAGVLSPQTWRQAARALREVSGRRA